MIEKIRPVQIDDAFAKHLTSLGIEYAPIGAFLFHAETAIEPPMSLYGINIWAFPARIGAFSYFGNGDFLNAEIGRYCSVGAGIRVGASQHPKDHLTTSPVSYHHFMNFQKFFERKYPGWQRVLPEPYAFEARPRTVIGNDVWIGAGVYIKDGIIISDGAIIGAHAVVTKHVGPYQIVAGNPAKVIGTRFSDKIVERLLGVQWWRYNIFELDVDARNIVSSLSRIEELVAGGKITPYEPGLINLIEEHDKFVAAEVSSEGPSS